MKVSECKVKVDFGITFTRECQHLRVVRSGVKAVKVKNIVSLKIGGRKIWKLDKNAVYLQPNCDMKSYK